MTGSLTENNFHVIFLFKIIGFQWKNCTFVNQASLKEVYSQHLRILEGKTGRDTSGVGLLFRCWHVTDQHNGHQCLMWATQYNVTAANFLHTHATQFWKDATKVAGREVSISSSKANLCQANNLQENWFRTLCPQLYIFNSVQDVSFFSISVTSNSNWCCRPNLWPQSCPSLEYIDIQRSDVLTKTPL